MSKDQNPSDKACDAYFDNPYAATSGSYYSDRVTFYAGFAAGAASRDAEIHRLQMALADTEQLELGTAERCDQLREQVVLLRDALKEAVEDYSDRFDMSSPSTNPGIKMVVKQGKEALAATEPKP